MILTRRWTLVTIFETVQAVRGKAGAPRREKGVRGDTYPRGEEDRCDPGGEKNDLGASRPTLQFRALGRQQPRLQGLDMDCFRVFLLAGGAFHTCLNQQDGVLVY